MSGPLLGLTGLGVALVVLGLVTARRPEHEVADKDGYFDRWQELHGGYDPRTATVWVRLWLTLVFRIGRPLARRGVQPDVVTLSSVWIALAVFVPAAEGGHWPILAGWVLVASGLFDTLDGCVAVLERRTTKWGYVLDSLVDRVNDVVYLVAVVSVGAPPELAVVCGVGFFLMEYARARAGNAGGDEVGRVTVGERPMRVIFLSASIHFGGVFVAHADTVATVGLSVMTAFTAVGLVQLLVALRRQLLALPVQEPAGVTVD
ncbi:MAG: CDP-diacylglycerol--glycerol-3-phosphate 3-phosphatidyltransferase [Frankiales bacterium]|nr:CDP-diacylglycerol--glycerol-3-phosphate 3-phosphatidyltransferase [Frankiales bacterium]